MWPVGGKTETDGRGQQYGESLTLFLPSGGYMRWSLFSLHLSRNDRCRINTTLLYGLTCFLTFTLTLLTTLHLHTSHISNRALLSFPMLQIYKNDSVISSHILNRVLLSFPMLLQKNQSLEILFACFSDEALCESTWLLEKSVVRVRIEHRPNSTWTPVNHWATRFHSTLPCVSSTRGSELFTYIKIKSPRPCRKNKKTRLFCYLYH